MKFYDYKIAPNPRRVRIFMAEKGIQLQTVLVDLAGGEQFSDAFKKINPDCTVPVLELDDGTYLSEVVAICQYLEEKFSEPTLLGDDASERALVTAWNAKIEFHGLGALAENFRNRVKGMKGRAMTGPDSYEQISELVDRGRKRFELFMSRLDQQLKDNEYIVGDVFTMADISAFIAVDFAAWSRISIEDKMVNLHGLYKLVSVRPSVQF